MGCFEMIPVMTRRINKLKCKEVKWGGQQFHLCKNPKAKHIIRAQKHGIEMLWQHLKQTIHVQKQFNVDTKAIPKWWEKNKSSLPFIINIWWELLLPRMVQSVARFNGQYFFSTLHQFGLYLAFSPIFVLYMKYRSVTCKRFLFVFCWGFFGSFISF